ncbi:MULTISPECIES: SH3 domain-containing protein [Streptomyces]|uniref:SH3 domain-containing protein n=1 Tax=Streptomyces TaxID=1883 RepID=UPI001966488A|nr:MULTISPECIES: SH3 domain-containing protein [Streptomyces]QRX91029.1 SH3 domain-containing protein [Streptomyces noursei]UJB40878.1 SH3 domain-containing protein [Streptomyces sp. A1-5]
MSTTDVLVARGKKLAAGAGALTTAVALGATLFAATPAQATPHPLPSPQSQPFPQELTGPDYTYGTVTAGRGMNEREYPSTDSASRGYLRNGARVYLVCKVRAQNIRGNEVWYLVRGGRRTWIAAKHVTNTGAVKYCNDGRRDRVQGNEAARHAG